MCQSTSKTYTPFSRHQILLKATPMGLKESTPREYQRRQEADTANSIKTSANTVSVANLTAGPPESSSQNNTSSPPITTTHTQHSQPLSQTQTHNLVLSELTLPNDQTSVQWGLPALIPLPPRLYTTYPGIPTSKGRRQ